jgi:FlhB-like protein
MMDRETASALSWDRDMTAPAMIAKGRGELAARIVEMANEAGVPVVKNPILADILDDVEIGSCIPPETWAAVAAIFAFLEKGTKEKWFL